MKALAIVLVLVLVGFGGVQIPKSAHASSGVNWVSEAPSISKEMPLTAVPDSNCPMYKQELFVVEYGAPRMMCIYGDERLQIGTFFEQGSYRAVVKFPYSAETHILDTICGLTCRYSADTDSLVAQQPISQSGVGLVVYRHASKRITRNVISNSLTKYEFDSTDPDYELKNDEGKYIWSPSFGVSENGKWIASELRDKGIAVINTENFSVRQIAAEGPGYGYGLNPSEELAVSNDGKSVALAGSNAGLMVYDVTPECGQTLTGDLGSRDGMVHCLSRSLAEYFPNLAVATHPKFFGDGHQLDIIAVSWGGLVQRATFITHGTVPAHQLTLLSAGDSFSSGEGETSDAFYEPGTNSGIDVCHVSSRAYPGVIAKRIGLRDSDAKNVACSGAKIGDIIGSTDVYWGQGDRLGISGLKLSDKEVKAAQEAALDNYQPGRTLQARFIDRYDPEILTIGIGGNDAGLMGKLRTCAMPGTCEWVTGTGIQETAGEISRLSGILESSFTQLKDKLHTSRVFVVGYPDIVNPDGVCDPMTSFLLNHTERVFIRNSIHYLNQVIRRTADKVGFMYVDVEHAFDGTALCSGSLSTSMNAIRLGDDVSVINSLPMLKVIGAETFHPTPSGHNLMAEAMVSQYPGLTGVSSTQSDDEIDSYWATESSDKERTAYVTDFAMPSGDQHSMQIHLSEGTLQPGSIATVEIHSDPKTLATFVVGDSGGVEGSVALPASLEEGFHTLHIYAVNRGGDDIDLYQFVTNGSTGNIQVGSGEGDIPIQKSAGIHDSSSTPSGSKEILTEIASVLGAQSTKDAIGELKERTQPIISYIYQIPRLVRWILFGTILIGVTTLSTLFTLIIMKRWAKPSS